MIKRGFATIPTLMALSMVILVIVIGTVTMTGTESVNLLLQAHASQALRYAQTGAKDALIKITRDKNYTCPTDDCYSIDMATDGCSANQACARVSISAGTGTIGNPKVIVAQGYAGNEHRKLQVEVIYDSAEYGEIQTTSWTELTD